LEWGVLMTHAVAAVYAERFSEAGALLDTVLATAERIGATEGVAVVQAIRPTRTGRLKEAPAYAVRASSLAHLVPFVEASAAAARADVLLQLGRADDCRRSMAWVPSAPATL
jgi:hypothetical protein